MICPNVVAIEFVCHGAVGHFEMNKSECNTSIILFELPVYFRVLSGVHLSAVVEWWLFALKSLFQCILSC